MAQTARDMQYAFLKFENMVKEYRHSANDRLRALDLKGAEIVCLQTLMYYADGLTAASLSSYADRDKAQISRTLRTLDAKGYITCNPADSKRLRKRRWVLTEAGKTMCSRILDASGDLWKEFSRHINIRNS